MVEGNSRIFPGITARRRAREGSETPWEWGDEKSAPHVSSRPERSPGKGTAFLVSRRFASLRSSSWMLPSAGSSSPAEDGFACEGSGATGTAEPSTGFPDIPCGVGQAVRGWKNPLSCCHLCPLS